jgi:predicted  nucleic acid-binding Zn-ribbon protein
MTFVGKILVIVIMVFAVCFLALSVTVFNTATNWSDAYKKAKDEADKTAAKLRDAKAETEVRVKELAKAKADHQAQVDQLKQQITTFDGTIAQLTKDITDARDKLETAQQNAKVAGDEAEARRLEAEKERELLASVQKQANDFKLQNLELQDQIRQFKRDIEVAVNNNKDLRERVAAFSSSLREHGLTDDIRQIKGVGSPPDVEGAIKRVDAKNKIVEITIGSDDGLVPGHELYIYRLKPKPEYVGKIRIQSADPDQAVGEVEGRTYLGRKIQEGDIVSPTFRPRS